MFTADHAVSGRGRARRSCSSEGNLPDDIHGMCVAQGIPTATGGMTSHAAVVGRQMASPRSSAPGRQIDEHAKTVRVGGATLKEGDWLSFDGLSGEVKVGQVASKPSEILQVVAGEMKPGQSDIYRRFNQLLTWADSRLGIRANADQPIRRRPRNPARAASASAGPSTCSSAKGGSRSSRR
jgi:pyruvate,orthophosphate dikinase